MKFFRGYQLKWIQVLLVSVCFLFALPTMAGDDKPDKVLYDQALEFLTQGKANEAKSILTALITAYPDSKYATKAKNLLKVTAADATPSQPASQTTSSVKGEPTSVLNGKIKIPGDPAGYDPKNPKISRTNGPYQLTECGSVIDESIGREFYLIPYVGLNWDEAKQAAEELKACGGGWRMPTYYEVTALRFPYSPYGEIRDLEETKGDLASVFEIGEQEWVWGKTTQAGTKNKILIVSLWFTEDCFFCPSPWSAEKKETSERMRAFAVRNWQPKSLRYRQTECGSILDEQTGLQWIVSLNDSMTYAEATAWAKGLSTCDGGWRLPTEQELRSIRHSKKGVCNNPPSIGLTQFVFWTNREVHKKKRVKVYYFDFRYNKMGWFHLKDPYRLGVIAVKSGSQ